MVPEDEVKKKAAEFFSQASPSIKKFKFKPSTLLTAAAIILALIVSVVFFTSSKEAATHPEGKITAPFTGAKTLRNVKITGYTKNLPPGRQYVWLIVDVKAKGLCWPKNQPIAPNVGFKTTIYEGGPNKFFTISLYALNQAMHELAMDWIKKERFGGLPIFPKRYKLHSVTVELIER